MPGRVGRWAVIDFETRTYYRSSLPDRKRGWLQGKTRNEKIFVHLWWSRCGSFLLTFLYNSLSFFSLCLAVSFLLSCLMARSDRSRGGVLCRRCWLLNVLCFWNLLLQARFLRRLQRATEPNTQSIMKLMALRQKYWVLCLWSSFQSHGALARRHPGSVYFFGV